VEGQAAVVVVGVRFPPIAITGMADLAVELVSSVRVFQVLAEVARVQMEVAEQAALAAVMVTAGVWVTTTLVLGVRAVRAVVAQYALYGAIALLEHSQAPTLETYNGTVYTNQRRSAI